MAKPTASNHGPWLRRSGQYWKYLVFWALVWISALAFVLFVVGINTDGEALGRYAVTAIVAGAAAFGWLSASIKCRRCNQSVAWWFLKHSNAGSWMTNLRYAQECPVCGDDGIASSDAGRRN